MRIAPVTGDLPVVAFSRAPVQPEPGTAPPAGPMVAAFARQEGIPYTAASAAVDRAVVAQDTAVPEPPDGSTTL